MEPVVLASARKHGIDDDDMLYAHRRPIRVFELDDLTMIISGDRTGRPIVFGVVRSEVPRKASSSSSTPWPPDRGRRLRGLSWKRIGKQLGTSAQAAQQRYGSFVEAP